MKGLLAMIFLALIWVIATTVQGDRGNQQEGEVQENIHQPHESTRDEQVKRGRHHSKKRSITELESAWSALLLTDDLTLFSEKEMTSFLKTLSQQEVRLLARNLFLKPDNQTALSRIIGRWAEFSPLEALQFLLDNEVINHDLFHHQLYVGWAKVDATAAFDHFKKSRKIKEDSEVELVTFSFIKSEFMRSMTLSDPLKAISVLLSQSSLNPEAVDLESNFSDSERDAVFEMLPTGTNWKEMAEVFADRIFLDHLEQPFSNSPQIIMKRGPGRMLFARWANEDPGAAIAWFEANTHKAQAAGTLPELSQVSELIEFWNEVNPGAAASWRQQSRSEE